MRRYKRLDAVRFPTHVPTFHVLEIYNIITINIGSKNISRHLSRIVIMRFFQTLYVTRNFFSPLQKTFKLRCNTWSIIGMAGHKRLSAVAVFSSFIIYSHLEQREQCIVYSGASTHPAWSTGGLVPNKSNRLTVRPHHACVKTVRWQSRRIVVDMLLKFVCLTLWKHAH